jgi:SseB protein C-terminal domain
MRFLLKDAPEFFTGSQRTKRGARVDRYALADSAAIRFLAEQDGPAEQEFKARLLPVFQQDATVDAAYLAIVQYRGEADVSVALCLLLSGEEVDKAIVTSVGDVFHNMFNRNEHVDILPLDHDQWELVRVVCEPFYVRAPQNAVETK